MNGRYCPEGPRGQKFQIEADCRMRLKTAALFAVGFLSVSSWLHDSARCQTSLAPPLSLVAPPSVTAEDAPAIATDDVAPPAAVARRSRPVAARDRPPTATLSPSPKAAADYDGFTAGVVDDEDTSNQTTKPLRARPAQQPKLRQRPDSPEGQSVDQMEDEKLRRSLVICRGCK
jgi:hypothetical protein